MQVTRFCLPTRAAFIAAAAGALALALTGAAHAQVDCSTKNNLVFVTGSSASKPFLAAVAKGLSGQSTPITLVYQSQGSCVGVSALTSSTPGKIMGSGTFWDAAGTEMNCNLTASGDTVDIGVSDVYAESCGATIPDGVKDYHGPVQTMTFVVPGGTTSPSSETVISAEAAYLTFGFGGDADTAWTDNNLLFRRNETSGTQQMIATAIKVPAAKWKGIDAGSSTGVLSMVTGASSGGNQDKAIGILATDVADKNRVSLKILGYQHYGQSCAYWPDTDDQSFDKANVRDGHYAIWGPLHLLAKTSGGTVSNANAKKVIDYLSGAADPEGIDLVKVEAQGGVVPDCAMRVKRTAEVGPLMSYMPEKSCECKFVAEATGSTPDACTPCPNGTGDCPKSAPACNYGFCEVK